MQDCQNLGVYFSSIGSDINGDGIFTISDLLATLWNLLVLPSKFYVFFLESLTGNFFELSCSAHEAFGWVVVSILFWLLFLMGIFGPVFRLFRRSP